MLPVKVRLTVQNMEIKSLVKLWGHLLNVDYIILLHAF